MKNVNINNLTNSEFDKYLNKANYLHERGLHSDKDVLQLAQLIYEKEIYNDDKKYKKGR